MRINKLLTILLCLGVSTQMASAAVSPENLDQDTKAPRASKMPQGQSIGFPDTMEVFNFQNSVLADLETAVDSLPTDVDPSTLTDEQLENYYDSELNFVESLLSEVRGRPEVVAQLGWVLEANAKKTGGRQGMSALTCMAVALEGEAGGEPAAGKAAVAETIMTRAGGNPSRVCSVVFARAQFEAMTKPKKKPSAETLRIARAAVNSGKKCGFDHFINKSLQLELGRKMPTWVYNFERRGCRSAKIGQHTFYSACSCKRK